MGPCFFACSTIKSTMGVTYILDYGWSRYERVSQNRFERPGTYIEFVSDDEYLVSGSRDNNWVRSPMNMTYGRLISYADWRALVD